MYWISYLIAYSYLSMADNKNPHQYTLKDIETYEEVCRCFTIEMEVSL